MPNYSGNIDHIEAKEIEGLFIGKKIVAVANDELTLSDGTLLQIIPNQGGCVCGAGDYWLESLNTFENIITNVEVEKTSSPEWDTYQIFVYSDGVGVSAAEIRGDDGNGYYGTGFEIAVKYKPQISKDDNFLNIFDKDNWTTGERNG